MSVTTIDEVIDQLTDIMDRTYRERSRLGYFATLYRKVTLKIKEGIAAGRFEDGARMERFDVVFANRYFDAWQSFRHGGQPSMAWLVTFRAAQKWRLLIVQHLLLGINTHVNLDLGIAAVQIAPADALPSLKHDFEVINAILTELLDEVQDDVAAFSPWLWVLDRIGGRTDEALINFSMAKARSAAWSVAERLASLSPDEQAREIAALDRQVTTRAYLIQTPGFLLGMGLLGIRLAESDNIARIIERLT
jgi:hypothetical protein